MSTILDALKKSEQERKLNKLPTLNDMATPQESSRWPIYIGLALVLVAIALTALAFVIWSGKPAKFQESQSLKPVNETAQAEANVDTPRSVKEANSIEISSATVVNVISYSDQPSLRFAMVNGKMVREGEFIEPGLKLEEILPNSVVFNARGEKVTRSP